MNPNPRLVRFVGGCEGHWLIKSSVAVRGEFLQLCDRVDVMTDVSKPIAPGAVWVLSGVTSNERYVTREEKDLLIANQPPLGRDASDCAALIPIRKNAEWWGLTQDERRRIFESQSHHTQIGLDYVPAIARKLHHCRDFAEAQPFDFLTWFEFSSIDEEAFNCLLERLRATEEWRFVEREVEIRLKRDRAQPVAIELNRSEAGVDRMTER